MNKRVKQFFIIVGIAVVICCIYLGYRLSVKTIFNEDTVLGNTAGNLYNGGLFCKQGETIYFSNMDDDGALYSMDMNFSQVKKLSTDKACYINADNHYIYYSRQNWMKKNEIQGIFLFYVAGLYRIDKNGGDSKTLYSKPAGCSLLAGNYVYYQHYDKKTGLHLYKVKIDGTKNQLLSKDSILPASVHDNMLFFSTGSGSDNHYIYTMELGTNTIQTWYAGNCYLPIATDDGVYYISLSDGYAICRMSYDGSKHEILVNEFCSTYNISEDGQTLYYQIDGGNENRIACMDLTTGIQTTILEGNYKNIHVIGNYVFFRDYSETTTYMLDTKTGALNTFLAPVLEK